jgi:chitinase
LFHRAPTCPRFLLRLWRAPGRRSRRVAQVVAVALTLSVAPSAPAAPAAQTSGPLGDFKVVGYFPSWHGSVDAIAWEHLTHVNYAFVLPTKAGAVVAFNGLRGLDQLVRAGHAHHVPVSIAVGGWNDGNDKAFEYVARRPALRATFVRNLIAFVKRHDLDGIDIDWEYPDAGESAQGYLALLRELRAQLAPAGKLLTTAVVGNGENAAGIPNEAFAEVDFVNIMAYDADEADPADSIKYVHHSPYEFAEICLRFWRQRGLPQKKAILGVPFYGKSPGTPYRTLVARDPEAPNKDQLGKIYYNGIPTMKRKTALARAEGGGIMIWELTDDTHDATSLLRAIHEAAQAPTPPPTSAPR